MKKVILLVCLMPCLVYGQIVENFEPGNLNNWSQSTAGRWTADTSGQISGRYSLHHIFDNSDSGTDQIGIRVDSLHPSEGEVSWSFTIRHGYDPSSSNNWAVFLMSDTDPFTVFSDGRTNGYVVGVNITGYDDTLRLCKIKGNSVTTVVNCRINWQTIIGTVDPVRIVVERATDGKWNLTVFRLPEVLIGTFSGYDPELFGCNWFVLSYKYSSSRDRLIWFDDLNISGKFYIDNDIPLITGCQADGKNGIRITLSDQPDDNFLAADNFSLSPSGLIPVSVVKQISTEYILSFEEELQNSFGYVLLIKNLCNRNGNCSNNVEFPFSLALPEVGDVVITEIMADPEPVVSLPAEEYLEITNRTGILYNLENWKLISGEQEYLFPYITINPYGSLIICSTQDTSKLSRYGKVLGLKPFPTLTDDGKLILLYDSFGKLIHGVEYSSNWYGDELKSGGGWSLEMIDTDFPFYYNGNWSASESPKGGTPGSVNSVAAANPDNSFSGDLIVFSDDSMTISVRSPEPLFCLLKMTDSISIEGNNPVAINLSDPLFRKFSFKLNKPVEKGKICQLAISGKIKDFAGNRLLKDNYSFGLTEQAGPGDILFNELLFNAMPGDPDYLELYNSSQKIIDASRLELVSVDDDSGDTSRICQISDQPACILPENYYAFTTDVEKVCARYFSADQEYIFDVEDIPTMSDEEGHLILFSRELYKIDELSYNEKMQSPLLSGYEGIALEKINPGNKSGDPKNWHSASESSGWGTPGAPNSVYSETPVVADKVSLSSTRISPDDDGYEDFLEIYFNLTGNSNVVSVTIFDESGSFVRKIAENIYVGPKATLVWDGTAEDGSMVSTGIYIVFITMFDDSGKTGKWKKVCTVIRR